MKVKNIKITISDKNTLIYGESGSVLHTITSNTDSEILIADNEKQDFSLDKISSCNVNEEDFGVGNCIEVYRKNYKLNQKLTYTTYEKYRNVIFVKASYTNISANKITLNKYIHHDYNIQANKEDKVPFWGYFGASYASRPDWILPLNVGFSQGNFMGMNSSDYGGGTPVIDIWNSQYGVAIGHTALKQYEVSLPIHVTKSGAQIGLSYDVEVSLLPGESYDTIETFIMVHEGDCFVGLSTYRQILIDKGLQFEPVADTAYDATWCAWGYERNFTMDQIYGAIPKIKEMGLEWVCLDDGYQLEEGDLELIPEKYPNGDQDMRDFVDTLHEHDLKAQLWWVPLAVDPKAKLFKEHPEWLLLDEHGDAQEITWWDCYYLCPAYKPVQEDIKRQLYKILVDWNYDGVKIDGQHLNSAAKCYNPEHNHNDPSESTEWMSLIMKMIYEVAKEIKKDVTVYYCPCGASYSIFTMPYYNVPVASDPESSWQVRSKGRVFKALLGNDISFHGDHVELSDNYNDFASTIGIGGVVDTKFTWPLGSMKNSVLRPGEDDPFGLDVEKEALYKKWIGIYNKKKLSKGTYHGELYTLGYDLPETHVVKKDDVLHYAFYASTWEGDISFKGLEKDTEYRVYDYDNCRDLGIVSLLNNKLNVTFKGALLCELQKI